MAILLGVSSSHLRDKNVRILGRDRQVFEYQMENISSNWAMRLSGGSVVKRNEGKHRAQTAVSGSSPEFFYATH